MEVEQLLRKLEINSKFFFRNIEWTVIEAYRYDWDEDEFSIEFKIKAGIQEAYLELEENDEEKLLLYFSTTIENDQLKPMVSQEMLSGEEVLTAVSYLGSEYSLKEIDEGLYTDLEDTDDQLEFTNFGYFYNDFFVNIVLWADNSMEFSYGEEIELDRISKIVL